MILPELLQVNFRLGSTKATEVATLFRQDELAKGDYFLRRGQTVRKLLDDLTEIEPNLKNEIINDDGEMTGLVHILVHGRNIEWLQGLDTTMREKDIITFLPPSAGG